MIYLNDSVSLLKAYGHPDAHNYSICKLWDELKSFHRWHNTLMRTKAVTMLEVMVTSQTGEKNAKAAVKQFNKFLEDTFGDGQDY